MKSLARLALLVLVSSSCARNIGAHGPESGRDPVLLLGGVPADAALVAAVDLERDLGSLTGLLLDETNARALRAELDAFFKERLGLEPLSFHAATLFVTHDGKSGALIAHGVRGTLRPGLLGPDESLRAVQHGTELIVGDERGVRSALDVLDGKTPGFEKATGKLRTLFDREASGAAVAVVVDASALAKLRDFRMLGELGLEAGILTMRAGRLRGVLVGPDDKLRALAGMIDQGIDGARGEVDRLKARALQRSDLIEGAIMIVAARYFLYFTDAARPKVADGALVMQVDLPLYGAAMMVPMAGILSAVAIPAFMKNARKAKTFEAVVNVKKMYDGARSYFEEESTLPRGPRPLPAQFPLGHVGPTPPLGSCCQKEGGKCAPDPALWTDPVWQALKFSMDDPYRFSYEYTGVGTGTNATFSVDAYGDLNCNGIYSTFEMVGSVQADGTVTGQAGLFRDKELE